VIVDSTSGADSRTKIDQATALATPAPICLLGCSFDIALGSHEAFNGVFGTKKKDAVGLMIQEGGDLPMLYNGLVMLGIYRPSKQ